MKRLLQPLMIRTALVLSLTALGGCAPLLVGGAVITGISALDRRTTAVQIEDETIELKVGRALWRDLGDKARLNVTSYNRRVLLTGQVLTEADKTRAQQIALTQDKVVLVHNELSIGAVSTVTKGSKDAYITGRVKAALIDAKDLHAQAFKVVTEGGVVYLMGQVTPREAQRASDIARHLSDIGVLKVVRLFEQISEDELVRPSQPAQR